VYDKNREFVKTISPSMDILVSSNLERLLFLASDGDTALVSACMRQLGEEGFYKMPAAAMEKIRAVFSAGCCDEAETAETIGRVWRDYGYLCDTHTAVAFHVAEAYKRDNPAHAPVVVLSTASPFKFPAAVLRAVGGDTRGDEFEQMERLAALSGLPIPRGLAGLREKEVLHKDVIDRGEILSYVLEHLKG
ncbi:MAG: threonine synthase, partial [Oscillospiraceae bacterium]|nr:threonine synthase [Oscillospiraceae bacterium]